MFLEFLTSFVFPPIYIINTKQRHRSDQSNACSSSMLWGVPFEWGGGCSVSSESSCVWSMHPGGRSGRGGHLRWQNPRLSWGRQCRHVSHSHQYSTANTFPVKYFLCQLLVFSFARIFLLPNACP